MAFCSAFSSRMPLTRISPLGGGRVFLRDASPRRSRNETHDGVWARFEPSQAQNHHSGCPRSRKCGSAIGFSPFQLQGV
eukprot:5788644-Pyramimonas_sp.AAC.1